LVGRAGKDNGHRAEASGAIYNQDGVLLAEADAVMVNVPAETVANLDAEKLGWKVYPDGEKTT
jgi:hypothetical protein